MKRLFAYIGFSMLITFTIVFYLGNFWGYVVLLLATIIMGLALLIKRFSDYKGAMLVVSIVAMLSSLYSMAYTDLYFEPNSNIYNNQIAEVSAVLKSESHKSYTTYFYELNTKTIDSKTENVKILLKTNNQLNIEYGDTINCKLILTKCTNNYYKSKGYFYEGQSQDYFLNYSVNKEKEKDLGYFPILIRNKLCHSVSTLLTGDESSLCNAVALGDKYGLSKSVYKDFTNTGLTYLIVVSGLHMSIVSFCILSLLKGLSNRKIPNIFRCISAIIFVFLFMAITGFTSSVVRSGVMTILSLVGSGLWRKSDPVNNLGFSAVFLLALNPYAIGDVGLLYSFASVWGIVVIYPGIMAYVKEKLKSYNWFKTSSGRMCIRVIDMLVLSLSCVLCITPISLANFGSCNPLVIILSVFISPAVSVLLVLVLICSVFWYIPFLKFISYAAGFFAYFIAKYILWGVRLGVNIPLSKISLPQDFIALWLIISGVIFAFVLIYKNRRRLYKFAIALSYAILIIGVCLNIMVNYYDLSIEIYDSGKGTTAVANISGEKTVLSCGGDLYHTTDVINKLMENCANVNSLVVPSANNYDSKYSESILEEFDVNSVLLYYKYTTNEGTYQLARNCPNYRQISNNQTVTVNLGKGITDVVICTNNHTWQYIYNQNRSILIVPQNSSPSEIPEKFRKADILVMSKEIKDFNLLEYNELVWTSSEEIPYYFENAVSTKGKTISINMK
ncbi:MAG: ComEC/Rec2 family competence protein [Ruminococcus sp.]